MSKKEVINIENYNNIPDLIYGSGISEFISLNNLINNLNRSITSLSNNFISIGYYLKQIKDHSKFKELGFESIYDFAEEKYHFSKTSTKNFIAVYEKFGDGESSYPQLNNKYDGYNFSQLVELVSVKDDLSNYSPTQSVKEMRVTKLANNLDSDKVKIENWFNNDLVIFLKNQYPNCKFKVHEDYSQIYIIYNHYTLSLWLTNEYLIHVSCYTISKFKDSNTILSCKLVKQFVDRFIKYVDEECKNNAAYNTSDTEEIENNGQTSDQSIQEEEKTEELEVEVLDEKVHVQMLRNNDQRWDYVRNQENYELIEEMSNDYVHFLKLKNTPFVRLEVLVNPYEYNYDKSVKPSFAFIDNFKALNNGLFDNICRYDARVIVDYLRENKI